MDDAARVGVGERGGDRREQDAHLVPGERASGDERREAVALDQLHHEDGRAVVVDHVVEADDVRVLEPRERGRLALEAHAQLGLVGDPGVEDLHGDVAVEPLVVRAPDDAHAAATELLAQPVAPSDDLDLRCSPCVSARGRCRGAARVAAEVLSIRKNSCGTGAVRGARRTGIRSRARQEPQSTEEDAGA